MKKNEGFSLVELIVVVAIMAVLIGILAPAYLGYVEKTRKGTDENTAEEIRAAVEKAIAGDLNVYDEIAAQTLPISLTISATSSPQIDTVAGTNSALKAAIAEVFGTKKFEMKSKAYKGKTLTIYIQSAGSTFEVGAKLDGTTIKEPVPATK